jgi:hypothetical protein
VIPLYFFFDFSPVTVTTPAPAVRLLADFGQQVGLYADFTAAVNLAADFPAAIVFNLDYPG